MAAYQGTHFSQAFTFALIDGVTPINITAWTFNAEFRVQLSDVSPLLTLTSGAGFAVLDGPNGVLRMDLTPAQTSLLPVGGVLFDVLRTDQVDGPVFLFSGKLKVKQPVTR